jgi:pimeloyl-ACP methyl ester carboxylesterase
MAHIDRLRSLLFHDPDGYMAKMILADNPDDERRVAGFQAMTVLARLTWERPYDPKLARRLHRIQCPTLLLWGANDGLVPPAYGEAYRQHLPHSEMKLIPECGHLAMFEKEAEFVEAVTTFCSAD